MEKSLPLGSVDRGSARQALHQKKAGIDAKRIILRRHIYPALGDLPLDQISTERVARFCAGFTRYNRKT